MKKKHLFKILPVWAFSALTAILFAFSCSMPVDDNGFTFQSGRGDLQAKDVVDAPYLSNFVGNGYDILSETPRYIGKALEKNLVELDNNPAGVGFSYNSYLLEDSSDVQNIKKLSVGGSLDTGSAFGGVSVGASFNYDDVLSTAYSGRTIYVLVRINYKWGEVILAPTANPFRPEAIQLYKDDKAQFFRLYGTGYNERTILGGSLFYLYSFKFSNQSSLSYNQLKAMLSVSVAGFKVSGEFLKSSLETSSNQHVETSIQYYGNTDFIPSNLMPKTENEIKIMANNFADYLKAKYQTAMSTLNFSRCGEMGYSFKSYEDHMKDLDSQSQYNADELNMSYRKLLGWFSIRAKLTKVLNDLESGKFVILNEKKQEITPQLTAAINSINTEMGKCRANDQTAAEPNINNYTNLISLENFSIDRPNGTVVSPTNILLTWPKPAYFYYFNVYVHTNVLVAHDTPYRTYTISRMEPGIYEWMVSAKDINGYYYDSLKSYFLVPGFDTLNSPKDKALLSSGYTTFYLPDTYNKLNNTIIVSNTLDNSVQTYSAGYSPSFDVPLLQNGSIYQVTVRGTYEGVSKDSIPLTYYTKNTLNIIRGSTERMLVGQTRQFEATASSSYTYEWIITSGFSAYYGGETPITYRALKAVTRGLQSITLRRTNKTTKAVETQTILIYIC